MKKGRGSLRISLSLRYFCIRCRLLFFRDSDTFLSENLKTNSSPNSAASAPNVCKHYESHSLECESLLFVTNHTLSLRPFKFFSNSFIDFYNCEVVSSSDMRKHKHEVSHPNGG